MILDMQSVFGKIFCCLCGCVNKTLEKDRELLLEDWSKQVIIERKALMHVSVFINDLTHSSNDQFLKFLIRLSKISAATIAKTWVD